MGGLVFSNPGPTGEPALKTPRLSPKIYVQLRDKYVEELKRYFSSAIALAEVPGKVDFGDVDIIVEQPKTSFTADQLAKWLGAARYRVNGPLSSFAVPLPDTDDLFAQIDVETCPEGFIQWEIFHNSFGDLWQILGSIIRDNGLTASDKGLHVRIPELEQVSRKGSRMFLTKDPTETMQLLGLDINKYKAGFANLEDIYSWCAACKFFHPGRFQDRLISADERRRRSTRKMYRDFAENWVPQHPEIGLERRSWTREETLAEALQTFGKNNEYAAIMKAQRSAQAEEKLWSRIAAVIPETGDAMNLVMRGLRRWTGFSDGKPFVRASPVIEYQSLSPWVSFFSADELNDIVEWVKSNWQKIKLLEKRRVSASKAARKKEVNMTKFS